MRATFYEALEVPSTAETPAIRAALRTILRRFWSVPRDPSGDTEEAVRFVALGAAILTDNARREAYDVEARRGATVNPWRVGNDGVPLGGGDGQALGLPGSHGGESAQFSIGSSEPKLIPTVRALTNPLPEHLLWATGFGYVFSACVLGAAALLAYFASTLWLGTISAMLVMLAVLVAGIVGAAQTKIVTTELSGFTLARLAVTKWRRETSVFIGNPAPAQDTAWIFRLRVMELTRSTSGYSSAPHFVLRLLARLTDYALIALSVLFLLLLFSWIAPQLSGVIAAIRSPLLLPIIVVLLAIPLETIAIARYRTTPGKYLLGVVVASAVTQPDDQPNPDLTSLSAARAFTVARDGASFGVWPIALLRWRGIARALRVGGTWEAAGDSVTLLRAAPLFMRAAAISLVIACSLALALIWAHDAKSSFAYLSTLVDKATISAQSTKPESPVPAAPAPAPPAAPQVAPAAQAPGATTSAPPTPTNAPVINPAPPVSTPPAVATVTPPKRDEVIVLTKPDKSEPAPTKAPAKTEPAKATPPRGDFDRQTALAQERRNRIDNAERRVAAARASGSYAALQGVCERWTIDQPGSAEAWRCLGLAKYQAGAGRDALPALRQSLKIEANDPQVEAAILSILRP
jgi:hypothetical protein